MVEGYISFGAQTTATRSSHLTPDADQLGRFVRGVFLHADSGGYVSLRAFPDTRDGPPCAIRAVQINGSLDPLIEAAVDLATFAATAAEPIVFCPPVSTFTNGNSASEDALKEGLTLSVECDAHPAHARETLSAILGPPTFVVASGGKWTDPASGETQDKLHLHWRLREPTITADEHAELKRARALACDIVGADASAKTIVHPMRWPGSVHSKAEPRLAQIVEESTNEIDLNAAFEALEAIAETRGLGGNAEYADQDDTDRGGDPALSAADLLECAHLIPNDSSTDWAAWNRIGMAFRAASQGSDAGYIAFDHWSAKSAKYNKQTTRARWKHFFDSPPTKIGAGTLVYLARLAGPNFKPGPAADDQDADDHQRDERAGMQREFDDDAGPDPGDTDPPKTNVFRIYSARQVLTLPQLPFRIEAIGMPQRGLGAIVGPSGHGKGLVTQDLAFRLARDRMFHGEYSVEPCAVAIVVAEGFGGIPGRQRAVYELHDIDADEDVAVFYIAASPHIDNALVAERLAAQLVALEPCPRVALIDTYRATNSGDENDSSDAAKYVRGMTIIAEAIDGFACALAHSPWNADRERGSTAFRAAMDWVALIQKEDDIVTMSCLKSKDGPEFKPMRWRIEPRADSATVVPIGDKEPERAEPSCWNDLPANCQRVLQALSRDFGEDGAATRDLQRASRVPESSFFRTTRQLRDWGFVRKEKSRHVLAEAGRGILP